MVQAFLQETNFTVSEDSQAGIPVVCVALQGMIERDVVINLFTEDDTATGNCKLSL